MKLIKTCLPKAAMAFLVFAILTGVVYTGVLTGAAQLFYPYQANGSVIVGNDGKKYSMLLGQQFTQDKYLQGRMMDLDFSRTGSEFTNGQDKTLMYSWGSNKSPAGDASKEYNPDFDALMNEDVAERVKRIKAANPAMGDTPIPVDLVTNSGSGLDPHISPAGAEYQVARIAQARDLTQDEVRAVIKKCTEGKFLWLFGEERVHVLKVNLMLDGIVD